MFFNNRPGPTKSSVQVCVQTKGFVLKQVPRALHQSFMGHYSRLMIISFSKEVALHCLTDLPSTAYVFILT